MQTFAYQAETTGAPLQRVAIERRQLRADDVAVQVTFCGVCHSDVHAWRTPAADGSFPLVPGHEFVGEVVAVGSAVQEFAVGDPVAVGNIVDSCGECAMCRAGQENFCEQFPTLTYGGTDRYDGSTTRGAYSGVCVVRDAFVYHRPRRLDPAAVAPLMCAGITVWEPLRAWNVGVGTRLGVVGLGGLGHLAVLLGSALGAEVTVFTTNAHKVQDARELGAVDVVVSTDQVAMQQQRDTFDLIIDTVSAEHDLTPYLSCVALDGTLCSLGYLGPITLDTTSLLVGRKRLASAGSGGRPRTRELLDFCGEHDIAAVVEAVPGDQVNDALARVERNDARYRLVLDLSEASDPSRPPHVARRAAPEVAQH